MTSIISSLTYNQHNTFNWADVNQNYPYSHFFSHCAKDPHYLQLLREQTKLNDHLDQEGNKGQESPQSLIPSLSSIDSIYFSHKQGINNLLQKKELKSVVSQKKEAFLNEVSAFIGSLLRRKVNEKMEGESLNEDNKMNESKTMMMMMKDDDALSSYELFVLNQIRIMREKFFADSNSLMQLLDEAFESFFNKENSVEASFEKEINDIMNDSISDSNSEVNNPRNELVAVKEINHELRQNMNSNQSTSVPSNSLKINDDPENEEEEDEEEEDEKNSQPSELSSHLPKDQGDQFISSIKSNNNNNDDAYSFNSSNSSISLLLNKEREQPQEQYEEDASTKERRFQIEELILMRTFNKSIDEEEYQQQPKKVTRDCIVCNKQFSSRPDQTWRTRCYYCQQEFKKGKKESKKGKANKSTYKQLNQAAGRSKQVCIDCKKIFVVPSALVRKRKRCYACYQELNENNLLIN